MPGPNGIPSVPEINVIAAWKQVVENSSYILDVREPDELVEISIPGAMHVPLGSLPGEATGLPRDRGLLVICRSGVRSAFATQFLLASGFDGAKNISGGVIAWMEARLPHASNGYADLHSQPSENRPT